MEIPYACIISASARGLLSAPLAPAPTVPPRLSMGPWNKSRLYLAWFYAAKAHLQPRYPKTLLGLGKAFTCRCVVACSEPMNYCSHRWLSPLATLQVILASLSFALSRCLGCHVSHWIGGGSDRSGRQAAARPLRSICFWTGWVRVLRHPHLIVLCTLHLYEQIVNDIAKNGLAY